MENKKNQFAVVCVIGQPGSGKDALANYLVEKRLFATFPLVILSGRK